MILNLFDSTPEDSDTTNHDPFHGPLGPAHAALVEVDYAYQVEQWVIDIGKEYPKIVRAECPDIKRKWNRNSPTTFEEVPW